MRDALSRTCRPTLLGLAVLETLAWIEQQSLLLYPGIALGVLLVVACLHPRRTLSLLATLSLVIACFSLLVVGLGPRTGLYRTVTALSGSMEPTFYPGDVLILTRERTSQIRLGQIITYQIPVFNHPVESHRVVTVSRSSDGHTVIQTKGDANQVADGWKAQLDGNYVWQTRVVVPKVGWVLVELRQGPKA